MRLATKISRSRSVLCLLLISLLALSGCAGFTAQMLYVLNGQKVDAAFEGLVDKRVAVVCVSSSQAYGPTSAPEAIASEVGKLLSREVDGIEVIHQNEIVDWIDKNDWDQINYKDVGRGVEAEMLVAIDLGLFTAVEGRLLYRGQANFSVKVFDMSEGGVLVYESGNPEFKFPRGGQHATGISESRFRRIFAKVLAQEIARDFYPYEFDSDIAINATLTE